MIRSPCVSVVFVNLTTKNDVIIQKDFPKNCTQPYDCDKKFLKSFSKVIKSSILSSRGKIGIAKGTELAVFQSHFTILCE